MRISILKVGFLIISIFLIGLLFQEHNDQIVRNVLAKPNSVSRFYCGYENITAVFQSNGMPPVSIIKSIEKIDVRYISVSLYNNLSNRSELYIYDLGNDSRFKTLDDRGFLIDPIFLSDPANGIYRYRVLFESYAGSITNSRLYWVKPLPSRDKEIKSCILTSQGCVNTTLILTVSRFIEFESMTVSFWQNRLYLASSVGGHTFYYDSCSLQQGHNDSCSSNGATNFTNHYSNFTNSFYKNAGQIGFVTKSSNITGWANETYLFDIDTLNPSMTLLPRITHADSISSALSPSFILAIYQNSTTLNESIALISRPANMVLIDDLNIATPPSGVSLENLETGDVGIEAPLLIDIVSPDIITVYNSGNLTVGKRAGWPTQIIYNNSFQNNQGEMPVPKVILPDSSILGYIPSRKSIVKFTCRP